MLFPEQPTIPWRFSEMYLFCKPCHLNKLLQKCWPQSSAGLGEELKDTGLSSTQPWPSAHNGY